MAAPLVWRAATESCGEGAEEETNREFKYGIG
jgi:hypothetical protein